MPAGSQVFGGRGSTVGFFTDLFSGINDAVPNGIVHELMQRLNS
jgi:hypothetical protein